MFIKITYLKTLRNYVLLAGFSNGKYKLFDLKPFMSKYKALETLKTVHGLYEQAKIDAGGYGVVWNDDIDVSADAIYTNGVDCNNPKA